MLTHGMGSTPPHHHHDLASSVALSIALDDSTDIQDNPQLALFTCYVSEYLCVKEELLELVAIIVSPKGVDMKSAID